MYGLRLLFIALTLLASALPSPAFELSKGDLLFQVAGNSAFSEAIADATAATDSHSFVHVAMVAQVSPDAVLLLEASPEFGVRLVELDRFLEESPSIGDLPGVVVKRIYADFCADKAVENALKHLGEPYDWYYLPDNGRMYCSELIYEAYLNADGSHFFRSRPMNFRAPDGEMPKFWTDLYNSLGMEVPEGMPGTNPADLAKDARLREVFRFF